MGGVVKLCRILVAAVVGLLGFTLVSASESSDAKIAPLDRPRGFAYVGAFFVTDIDSNLAVFGQDLPLGARVDISRELGLRSSLNVPRLAVGWRFGRTRSHALSFGWYDLSREGRRNIGFEIELPDDTIIPVGIQVDSFINSEIYRVSYTWFFHDDGKVALGFGGGFFVGNLGAGIRVEGLTLERGGEESLTAPLPVIGARIRYQITPKLGLLANSDWFLVDYEQYRGVLLDLQLFVNHQTFKHVGFGAGMNLQGLDLEVDD